MSKREDQRLVRRSSSLGSNILMRAFAPGRPDWHYLVAIVAGASCFILLGGVARHYLTYGTETDFAGMFVPVAREFLGGSPLHSRYHPPFYSIVLGAAYLITGDWVRAGLIISWSSGIVALVSSFLLFRALCGRAAGFGALLGLLGSGCFVLYWAQATSDVLFLAGFMVSLLLAVRAIRSGSVRLWVACGLVVGLCFITRTNAVSLVVLVVAPLFCAGSARAKLGSMLAFLAGVAIPVAGLAVFAVATGSEVLPRQTYVNLALTYFAEQGARNSDEARLAVAQRFTGLRDVLLHDPAAMARMYVSDLYELLASRMSKLIEMPLYYAILPGLIFLIGANLSPTLLVIAVVAVSQILLLNFKLFEARFYLFLVPWLGAAVGEMFRRVADAPWPPRVRPAVLSFLALTLFLAVGQATAKTVYILWHGQEEVSEVVPLARRQIQPGAAILSIKPHVGFYSGAEPEFFPNLAGLAELKAYVQARDPKETLYIFYGAVERSVRPQYADLARGLPPPWLEVVARSRKPEAWVLLRVK